MNPPGEFKDFGEDENIAPQRPPYLPPVRPRVVALSRQTRVSFNVPIATRCVLGGKSRVKAATLFLTPPFRLNS